MSCLDRYLAKRALINVLLALLFLTSLSLVADLLAQLKYFLRHGTPQAWQLASQYAFKQGSLFLNWLIAPSALLGCLAVLQQAKSQGEYHLACASGIDPRRLLCPFLLIAALASLGHWVNSHHNLPGQGLALLDLERQIKLKKNSFEPICGRDQNGHVYSFTWFDDEQCLKDALVVIQKEENHLQVLKAEQAFWQDQPPGWRFEKVTLVDHPSQLQEVATTHDQWFLESSLSLAMMKAQAKHLDFLDDQMLEQLIKHHQETPALVTTRLMRRTEFLGSFLLVLLILPLVARRHQNHPMSTMLFFLGGCLFHFALWALCARLGQEAQISPWQAALLPALFCLTIAIFFWRRPFQEL